MSVFRYDSYKNFLRDELALRKRPGLMTDLASQVGCDRTYLSQVLSGKAQLTPDHALTLAEAWALSAEEADFFLLLVLKERSGLPKAKQKIVEKLEKARKENLNLSKAIQTKEPTIDLPDALKLSYYSNWKFPAAHILTSIPEQTLGKIAQALYSTEEETASVLQTLGEMGLIEKTGGRYHHRSGNLHIPADSPLVSFHHLQWRMRAIDSASSKKGTHYTDVFSVSASDLPALQALLLSFIEKMRKRVSASGTETALAFTCDLFQVGE